MGSNFNLDLDKKVMSSPFYLSKTFLQAII